MNAMHNCSLALFLDLCFSLMKTWKSYDPPGNHNFLKSFGGLLDYDQTISGFWCNFKILDLFLVLSGFGFFYHI